MVGSFWRLLRSRVFQARSRATCLGLVSLLGLFPTHFAWGQDSTIVVDRGLNPRVYPARAPTQLVFDHVEQRLDRIDGDGRTIETWGPDAILAGPAPLIPVHPKAPVLVVVKNANSLLYSYEVEASVVQRRNLRPCSDIGRTFTAGGLLFGAGAVPSDLVSTVLGDTINVQALSNLFAPKDFQTRGIGLTSEEALAEEYAAIREPVEDYLSLMEGVVAYAGSIKDSLRVVARLADAFPIDSLLSSLLNSLEARHPGLSDPAKVPLIIETRTRNARPELNRLSDLSRLVSRTQNPAIRNGPTAYEVRAASTRWAGVSSQVAPAVQDFQRALLRIEEARRESTLRFTVEPSGDYRHLKIEVTRNDEFGEYEEIVRTKKAVVNGYTEPKVSLLCEVSIGVNWMDPPPSYGYSEDTGVRNEAAETRTSPFLSLILSPSRVRQVGGLVGVGIGDQKALDLYLGGSVRIFHPVMINGGWVLQKSPSLGDISEGDQLEDPSILTRKNGIPKKYKWTSFFGLSLVF